MQLSLTSSRKKNDEAYWLSEWERYCSDPDRQRVSLAVVAGRQVSRVLDVGCGAGQELLPFVRSLGAACIGVDISPEAVRVASRQFAELGYAEQVGFRCCPAESLPFQGNSFDLVICRLALPYTQNQRALLEIARVLAHDGLLILQIHHARRYLRNFRQGVASGRILYALYCARVLLAGTLYHITGQQPDRRILKQEVFQTRWMLRRVLSSVGLTIREELERSPRNPWTPTFLIEKHVARRRAHPVPPKLKHSP